MKINKLKQGVFVLGLCLVFLCTTTSSLSAQNAYTTDGADLLLVEDWTIGHYQESADVIQAHHQMASTVQAELKAGQAIQLKDGFQAALGSQFRAYIGEVENVSAHQVPYFDVATISAAEATKISLNNYPNPFQTQTTIEYTLPESAKVSLLIYNLTGKLQATLLTDEVMDAGFYAVAFDGQDLASGVYLCQLTVANQQISKKMIIN